MKPILTIAATSDIHINKNNIESKFFNQVNDTADLFLIAGDISNGGEKQVKHFLSLVSGIRIPMSIIFGGHDANENNLKKIQKLITENNHGIKVLEGGYVEYKINNTRVGIAGAKGFPGGFAPNELRGNIGEKLLKDFKKERDFETTRLQKALKKMNASSPDIRIAMTHVAPFKEVVKGEHIERYAFLGNSKLGDVIEKARVDISISGHAHLGPRGIVKTNKNILACNVGYSVNKEKMVWIDFYKNKNIRIRK